MQRGFLKNKSSKGKGKEKGKTPENGSKEGTIAKEHAQPQPPPMPKVPTVSKSGKIHPLPQQAFPIDLPPDANILRNLPIGNVPMVAPKAILEQETCFLGFGGKRRYWDTVCVTNGEGRLHLREHPQFETAFMIPDMHRFNAMNVDIAEIPGKGFGLIANRDFQTGDIIVVERPLLISPSMKDTAFVYNFDKVIDMLHPTLKPVYMALHNCKERGPGMIDSFSIARTNAIGISYPFDEMTQSAVCNLISRANHDCTNNADAWFDYTKFAMYLTALMPIAAGTELTFSYLSELLSPASVRQEILQRKWGFTCTCAACDPSAPDFAVTARNRAILRSFFDQTDDDKLAKNPNWTGYTDEYMKSVLDLIDKTRLFEWRPRALLKFTETAYAMFSRSDDKDPARTTELCRLTHEELKKLGTPYLGNSIRQRILQIEFWLRYPTFVIPFDEFLMGDVRDPTEWLATRLKAHLARDSTQHSQRGVAYGNEEGEDLQASEESTAKDEPGNTIASPSGSSKSVTKHYEDPVTSIMGPDGNVMYEIGLKDLRRALGDQELEDPAEMSDEKREALLAKQEESLADWKRTQPETFDPGMADMMRGMLKLMLKGEDAEYGAVPSSESDPPTVGSPSIQ